MLSAEFSHCLEAWAYKAESSVKVEKLPPKMVNAFGSTCVLLWRDFIYFIFLSLSLSSLSKHKEGTRDDHSTLRGPFQLRCEITKEARVILFYFISPYILHLLYNFYCSNMCLRVVFSPFHAFIAFERFLSLLGNGEEDKRMEQKKS